MTRLNSNSALYAFVFLPPATVLGGIIVRIVYIEDHAAAIMLYFILSILLLNWVLIIGRVKKVYYKGNSLYIFNLFSGRYVKVPKENIGGVNRVMFYDPRFYKIVYYDEQKKSHTVYFQRNWFAEGFGDIIDELNGR